MRKTLGRGNEKWKTRIFLNFDETLVNTKNLLVIPNYSAKIIENVLENLHKDLKILQKFQNLLVKFKKN